jgi:hypothetical protein
MQDLGLLLWLGNGDSDLFCLSCAEKEAASPAVVAESKSIPRTVASLSLSPFLVFPPLSFPLGHSSLESYRHKETVENITMYFRSKISKSAGTSSTTLQGFLNVEKNC